MVCVMSQGVLLQISGWHCAHFESPSLPALSGAAALSKWQGVWGLRWQIMTCCQQLTCMALSTRLLVHGGFVAGGKNLRSFHDLL